MTSGISSLAPVLVTADASGDIAPGDAALVFVDLSFAPEQRLPAQLRQRVRTEAGERVSANVEAVRERAIRLSPPLRGENLVDFNGCCQGAHGRAVLPTPVGGLAVAQRYAIDFLRIDSGPSLAGDPSDNASYFFIFGADVLAAADGLPYVFDHFRSQGRLELSGTGPVIVPTSGAELRQNRLPLDLEVVAFP